ncbi:MAG: hypothetical protein KC501_15460 [Myxococcales bacterium]|nr:hypothetical protein [Myxococcales bacterium]
MTTVESRAKWGGCSDQALEVASREIGFRGEVDRREGAVHTIAGGLVRCLTGIIERVDPTIVELDGDLVRRRRGAIGDEDPRRVSRYGRCQLDLEPIDDGRTSGERARGLGLRFSIIGVDGRWALGEVVFRGLV